MSKIDTIIRYSVHVIIAISLTICLAHISIYLGMGQYALDVGESILVESVLDTVNHDEVGSHYKKGSQRVLHRESVCNTALKVALKPEEVQQVKDKFMEEYTAKFNNSVWHNLFDMTELDVYQNNSNIVVKCNFKEKYTVKEHPVTDYLSYVLLPIND